MARRDFEKSGGGSEKVGRANKKDEHTMNEADAQRWLRAMLKWT